MKMLRLTTVALALIAAASLTTSVKAASATISASDGNLIFGAYDTSGVDTNSLEVNLGNFSSLTDGETFALGPQLSAAGLTDSSLVFTIATSGGSNGANGLVADEVQLTAPGIIVVPPDTSTAAGQIDQQISGSHGTAFTQDGSTAPKGAYTTDSNPSSFDSLVNSSGGSYGLASNAPSGVLASLAAGTKVNLYDFTGTADGGNGNLNVLGTFTVLSNGTSVEFNAAAVPEPSTYALMGISGLALLWALKRRNSVV